MIYGKRSDRELMCAKAKAKASEFFVDPHSIPDSGLNSAELHYSSVLTLSTYVNARLSGADGLEHMEDLQKTASFYDAASNDEGNKPFTDGYWMLAMATYFLLGNYGSAKVSAAKVHDPSFYGERAQTLHSLVSYLLEADMPAPSELSALVSYLRGFDMKEEDVIKDASALLTKSNPEDAFFSGILYVAISDAMSTSIRALLPRYTGLSIDVWRPYLSMQTSPKLLWQAQRQLGVVGVFAGGNAFVELPTGSGKTKSIELLLRARFLAGKCKLAIVVAPLRALCSEIARDLASALDDVAKVEQASEVMEIDSWFTESPQGFRVMVFTPEKLGFVMHRNAMLREDSDLFVFDEAHLLDSESRGPGYELLLTEIFRTKPDVQKVLMSAVVSNADEIAKWAFRDSNLIASGKDIQVTEKSIGLIQNEGTKISYVEQDDISSENYFLCVDVSPQPLKVRKREKERFFPDKISKASNHTRDLAIYYANRLLPNGACAIYVPKQVSLPPMFNRLQELIQRGANISNLQGSMEEIDKEKMSNLVDAHYGKGNWITSGIRAGVLPHYGDLQGSIRQAVEYEIAKENAGCIACTSTLAEGVNLPIKYLIITGAMRGFGVPRTRDFQNLIGRTARSGKFSEGSILLADSTGDLRSKRMYSSLMRKSNTERCESAILNLLADACDKEENPIKRVAGHDIVKVLLNHIEDPRLEFVLADFFRQSLGCNKNRAYVLASRRMRPLEAIESYLSGVIAASNDEVDVTNLCSSTYAYASSDEETQGRLLKLFQTVYDSLESVSKERASLYHKMQLGARDAASLIRWAESPEGKDFIYNGCSNIVSAVQQFLMSRPDVAATLSDEQLADIIELWVGGNDLSQMTIVLNKNYPSKPKLKIARMERVTSKVIRYSFSHFISCIIDIASQDAGLSAQSNLENLAAFQRKVKYGVSNLREAAVCEKVIDDRVIAKRIVSMLGAKESSDANKMKLEAIASRAKIEQLADTLPAYCSERILGWISK
ncbi:DEAD/DEAH box helicase [Mobiluncus curtisii]|uniref:DEAD/DEAH box helicase n=1 Tax=Mobiluncus curtisii ATCC 51333 TaxID=887326 RepID=E6LXQ7_9ACTO|nr:DEAD/DEAH box helicase [Mobiluncus curtisii]EFU80424.1 DEAD/DEAH box helicase [Mobiluncus curtisii ATCC 51333]